MKKIGILLLIILSTIGIISGCTASYSNSTSGSPLNMTASDSFISYDSGTQTDFYYTAQYIAADSDTYSLSGYQFTYYKNGVIQSEYTQTGSDLSGASVNSTNPTVDLKSLPYIPSNISTLLADTSASITAKFQFEFSNSSGTKYDINPGQVSITSSSSGGGSRYISSAVYDSTAKTLTVSFNDTVTFSGSTDWATFKAYLITNKFTFGGTATVSISSGNISQFTVSNVDASDFVSGQSTIQIANTSYFTNPDDPTETVSNSSVNITTN